MPARSNHIALAIIATAIVGWIALCGLQVYLRSAETELVPSRWHSSASIQAAGVTSQMAHDGDGQTRWNTTRPQAQGDWYCLDLGRQERVARIILDSRAMACDYPKQCQLLISRDNRHYLAAAATVVTNSSAVTTVRLRTPAVCRYLKLILTQSDSRWYWGINEISVYALPENIPFFLLEILPPLRMCVIVLTIAGALLALISFNVYARLRMAISLFAGCIGGRARAFGSRIKSIAQPAAKRLSYPLVRRIQGSRFRLILFLMLNAVLIPLFVWCFFNNNIQIHIARRGETVTLAIDGRELLRGSLRHTNPVSIAFSPPILFLCPQELSDIRLCDPDTGAAVFPPAGAPPVLENPWGVALRRGFRTGPTSTNYALPAAGGANFDLSFRLWNPLEISLRFADRRANHTSNLSISFQSREVSLWSPDTPDRRAPYIPSSRRYTCLILFRLTIAMVVAELGLAILIVISEALLLAARGRTWAILGTLAVVGSIFAWTLRHYSSIVAPLLAHYQFPITVFLLLLLLLPVVSKRLSPRAAAAFLFAAAFALLLYVNYCVFDHYPHFGDEMNYLVQAKIFAHGKLYVPEPEYPEFFKVPWQDLFWKDGKIWNFHNMGNSLLLAIGWLLKAPWIIPPLVGAFTVLFLYLLSLEIFQDRRTGFFTGLICLSSQFFASLSGSFMAHSPAACALTIFFYCLIKTVRYARTRDAICSGAALGFAFITRTLSAVLGSLPFLLYGLVKLLSGKLKLRHAALICLFFALVGCLDPLRMYLTMGKFTLPYWVKGPEAGKNVLSLAHYNLDYTLQNAWRNMIELSDRVFGLRYPLNLCFFFLPFLLLTGNGWDYLLLGYFLFYWIAHSAVHWYGWKFEPRMLFESFPAIALLSARGMAALLSLPDAFPRLGLSGDARVIPRSIAWIAIALFLTVSGAVDLPFRLRHEYKDYCSASSETRDVVAQRGIHHAIVFIEEMNFAYSPYVAYNALDCKGDIIYARDLGKEKDQELISHYPDRRIFYAVTSSNLVEEDNFFGREFPLIRAKIAGLRNGGYTVVLGLPWYRSLPAATCAQIGEVVPLSANEYYDTIPRLVRERRRLAFLLVEKATQLLPLIQKKFPGGKLTPSLFASCRYAIVLYLINDNGGGDGETGPYRAGLRATYYPNPNFQGKPCLVRSELDISIGNHTPFQENFSVEWEGLIRIDRGGAYTFETRTDDASWLYIDDQLVVDNGMGGAARSKSGVVALQPGLHRIRIRYTQGAGEKEHVVFWKPPGLPRKPITVETAINSLSHTLK